MWSLHLWVQVNICSKFLFLRNCVHNNEPDRHVAWKQHGHRSESWGRTIHSERWTLGSSATSSFTTAHAPQFSVWLMKITGIFIYLTWVTSHCRSLPSSPSALRYNSDNEIISFSGRSLPPRNSNSCPTFILSPAHLSLCSPALLSSCISSSSLSLSLLLSFYINVSHSLSLTAAGLEERGLYSGWRQKKTNNFSGHRK